ncbi:MAG: ABC transporter permease [Ilumatobacteraceae bacterium]
MLSRLIVGTRVAMLASGQAVLIALILGVPPGLLAGYFSGRVDLVIMRITDAVQSFPPLILAIAMVGILGPGLTNAMLAVGIVFSPNFLRIVRAAVLEIREETFIEASRSIGTPTSRIVRTRILPNVLPPLLVQISLAAGFALLAEASLSFLGLGVQPPRGSWGLMLGRGYDYLSRQPWLIVFPGLLIALAVLCFNVVGDGLGDSIGREARRER